MLVSASGARGAPETEHRLGESHEGRAESGHEDRQREGLAMLEALSREEAPVVRLHDGQVLSLSARVPFDAIAASADPVDAATVFVDALEPLFGVDSRSLFVTRLVEDDRTASVFFGQRNPDGVVVFGAVLAVYVDAELGVVGTSGHYLPTAPAFVGPSLSEDALREHAIAHVGGGGLRRAPEPLVFAASLLSSPSVERKGAGGPVSAWRVIVEGVPGSTEKHDHVGGTTLILRASDGAVLWSASETHTALGVIDLRVRGGGTTDPFWFCAVPGAVDWIDENGVLPGASPSAQGTSAAAFARTWHARQASLFGRDSWDDAGGQVNLAVDNASGLISNNAAWFPACHHILFDTGFVVDDVTVHELTHGLIQATSNLVYAFESGAINEHYADIEGVLLDRGDTTLAEDLAGGAIRDIANPPMFGQPDRMSNFAVRVATDDNGGVHTNSGIPNKALWLLLDGGHFNGVTVYRLGDVKFARFFHDLHTRRLTSTTTLQEYADLAIGSAQTWPGMTADDKCSVRNAWAAVELAIPDFDCDGTADVERDTDADRIGDNSDNCVDAWNADQRDGDRDGAGDVCDDDDDNDGVGDDSDNCRATPNPGQENGGGGRNGDACEDRDRDGVLDDRDVCPDFRDSDQRDGDHDGIGDACDRDPDDDGVDADRDNCGTVANPGQDDGDRDGLGDACDFCPAAPGGATDRDRDGIGDVCDDDEDGDGVDNDRDNCPQLENGVQLDTDHDGVGDACDPDGFGSKPVPLEIVLRGRLQRFERFRTGFDPCFGATCPTRPLGGLRGHVVVEGSVPLYGRVLDADGRVLAIDGPSTSLTLSYPVLQAFEVGPEGDAVIGQPTLELWSPEPLDATTLLMQGGPDFYPF